MVVDSELAVIVNNDDAASLHSMVQVPSIETNDIQIAERFLHCYVRNLRAKHFRRTALLYTLPPKKLAIQETTAIQEIILASLVSFPRISGLLLLSLLAPSFLVLSQRSRR